MVTQTTRPAAAAAPTCRRCHGRSWICLDAGADQFPYEVACPVCADQDQEDDDAADDGREHDDIAESCPDDSSRFAFVAAHYHAA